MSLFKWRDLHLQCGSVQAREPRDPEDPDRGEETEGQERAGSSGGGSQVHTQEEGKKKRPPVQEWGGHPGRFSAQLSRSSSNEPWQRRWSRCEFLQFLFLSSHLFLLFSPSHLLPCLLLHPYPPPLSLTSFSPSFSISILFLLLLPLPLLHRCAHLCCSSRLSTRCWSAWSKARMSIWLWAGCWGNVWGFFFTSKHHTW